MLPAFWEKLLLAASTARLWRRIYFSLWCSVLQLHKQADMQEEKNRIERVLGAISAPDLIQKVLTFALSVCTNSLIDEILMTYSPLCLGYFKYLTRTLDDEESR